MGWNKNYAETNIELIRLLEKNKCTGKELEEFFSKSNIGGINWKIRVQDGGTFWNPLYMTEDRWTFWNTFYTTEDGWKLQQHNIKKSHYRFLDNQAKRVAWTCKPEKLLQALMTWFTLKCRE